jgi:Cu(I)/Ag(I) efflux system protein CusF
MKTRSILLSGVLLAATLPGFAQSTSGMQNMKSGQTMSGMKMHQNMPCMQMAKGMPMNGMPMSSGTSGMPMGKNMPCSNQTAQGTGVVEAVNTAKGTVTIKHQAIASIHWPAMTMTFKADPPSLLRTVKVGEKVNFTLHPADIHSTVTAIASAKSTGH